MAEPVTSPDLPPPFAQWPADAAPPYWAAEQALSSVAYWSPETSGGKHLATTRYRPAHQFMARSRRIDAVRPAEWRTRIRLAWALLRGHDRSEDLADLLAWGRTTAWLPALGMLVSEGRTRERWMSHPNSPAWAWRLAFRRAARSSFALPATIGRLILHAPPEAQSVQRAWLGLTPAAARQTSPDAGLTQIHRWGALRQAIEEGARAGTVTLERLPPEAVRQLLTGMDALTVSWDTLRLAAEDPRPWPPAHWQHVLDLIDRLAAPLHTDDAPGDPTAARMLHRRGALSVLLALQLRADVRGDVLRAVETRVAAYPADPVQIQTARLLTIHRDLDWAALEARAGGLLRQATAASGATAPDVRALAEWMAEELQGTDGRPPRPRGPIWRALGQVPRLLIEVRRLLTDPTLLAESAQHIAAWPPSAWRPLLLDTDPEVRLVAIQALGQTAPTAATPADAGADRLVGPPPTVASSPVLPIRRGGI